jgi:hypothetical protein
MQPSGLHPSDRPCGRSSLLRKLVLATKKSDPKKMHPEFHSALPAPRPTGSLRLCKSASCRFVAGHRALRDDCPPYGKISGVGFTRIPARKSLAGCPKSAIPGRFTPKISPPVGCYDGEQRAAFAALTAQQIQNRKNQKIEPKRLTNLVLLFAVRLLTLGPHRSSRVEWRFCVVSRPWTAG